MDAGTERQLVLGAAFVAASIVVCRSRKYGAAAGVCAVVALLVAGVSGLPDAAVRDEAARPPPSAAPPATRPDPPTERWRRHFPMPRDGWGSPASCAAARSGTCDASHAFCGVRFNETVSELEWQHQHAAPCFRPYSQEAARRLLRGRRVLFAGDSNVRALAIAVFGMLCNHRNLIACHPHNVLREPQMRATSNCDPLRCDAAGTGTDACEAGHAMRAVDGLTTNQTYTTKAERKRLWKADELSAARVMTAGGATLIQLAVPRPSQMDQTLQHYASAGVDAVVGNMGSHLSFRDWEGQWWLSMAGAIQRFTSRRPDIPLLWTETGWPPNYPHCCACYRRNPNSKLRKVQMGSYCTDQMEKRKAQVDGAFFDAGARVIRLGGPITANYSFPFQKGQPGFSERWSSSRPSSCLYSDPTHPEVRCMYAMATVLLNLLALSWERPDAGAAGADGVRGTHWPIRMLRPGTPPHDAELSRLAQDGWWDGGAGGSARPLRSRECK
eukprot:TRINITY_DN47535_c0_g1_i1.p1 TRINITY_DN47535_c0_g1~~TRINITY_DN47535_c0_g1_i1.p1  ORF type:complete len:498 (+),score=148.57 TRINITY_DN47535_c0_g1_i1:66-1559(+)